MTETENSQQVLDDFEDFLADLPYPEDVDEEIAAIHEQSHAAEDMYACPSCDELFDMADDV